MSIDDYEEISKLDQSKDINSQLNKIQGKYREKWSTFNTQYCLWGLFALALSILSLLAQLGRVDHTSIGVFKDSILLLFSVPISGFILRFNFSISLLVYLIIFNVKFLTQNFQIPKIFKLHEILIIIFINLIPFSNSFIINENVCLRFFLISLLFAESLCKKSIKEVLLALLVRLTWVFYVCREEVASFCTQTIFSIQLEKLTSYSYFTYFGFICFNFSLILAIYYYLAKTRLHKFLLKENLLSLMSLILLFAYFLIQLQSYEHPEKFEHYKNVNLNVARLIHALTLTQLFITRLKSGIFRLFNSMIVFAIFMSLLNSQSLLSIWILVFILFQIFVPAFKPTLVEKGKLYVSVLDKHD